MKNLIHIFTYRKNIWEELGIATVHRQNCFDDMTIAVRKWLESFLIPAVIVT